MRRMPTALIGVACLAALGASSMLFSQGRPDSAALLAAQRQAMLKLSFMDGVWRGTAWTILPSGEKHTITQTERIGPFLDGAVKVIEGRGFETDGSVSFNALGIISYDPAKKAYSMRSYAQGMVGDFAVTLTENGFSWEIPAGPMTIRYMASIHDGHWTETGFRVLPGKEPVQFFEMNLERLGDSPWPATGAVSPK